MTISRDAAGTVQHVHCTLTRRQEQLLDVHSVRRHLLSAGQGTRPTDHSDGSSYYNFLLHFHNLLHFAFAFSFAADSASNSP